MKVRHTLLLPLLCSVVYFCVVFFNIGFHHVIGLANTGDFERMMTWVGVSYIPANNPDKYFNWINRYYYLNTPERGDTYSSEQLFHWVARGANALIYHTYFDIALLGVVHIASLAAVLYFVLSYALKMHKMYFVLVAIFACTVLIDSGYTAYFNSFYQEPSGIIFLFLFIAVILKSIYELHSPRDHGNILLLTVSSLLLITAKAQYVTIAIPIILVLNMLYRNVVHKRTLVTASLLIALSALTFYVFGTPDIVKKTNHYNALFYQVLNHAEDKLRAAAIIGVDAKSLQYAGAYAWGPGSGLFDPSIQRYLTMQTSGKIVYYYLITPKEFFHTVKSISSRAYTLHINFLGYYENNGQHAPLENAQTLTVWSTIKQKYLTRLHPVFLPLLFLALGFSYILYRNNTKKKLLLLYAFTILAAILQLFTVALTEGMQDVEKHLFLYNILFDLFLLQSLGMVLTSLCRRYHT